MLPQKNFGQSLRQTLPFFVFGKGPLLILSLGMPQVNFGRASGGPFHFLCLGRIEYRLETKILLSKGI